MQQSDKRPVKYILVTGGVVSSLGKGLAAAQSRASRGHATSPLQTFDRTSRRSGTMTRTTRRGVRHRRRAERTWTWTLRAGSPTSRCDAQQQLTTGKLYLSLAERRRGDYLGRTSRSSHITNRSRTDQTVGKTWTSSSSSGGTVVDIESLPFVEAIRQLRQDVDGRYALYHLTWAVHRRRG